MKRVLKVLSVITVLCCFVNIIACSSSKTKNTPLFDLRKASFNLQANGYVCEDVNNIDNQEGLIAALFAYNGENNEQITILQFKDATCAKLNYNKFKDEQKLLIKKTKLEIEEYKILLKNSSNILTEIEINNAQKQIEELEHKLNMLKEQKENSGFSYKYVWYGTKLAIEDTK